MAAKKPEVGEKIEFLISHSGPFQTLGEIRAVVDQPGLGAISLEGLWFLRQHVSMLPVQIMGANREADTLQVLVPRLGAYMMNKAATFSRVEREGMSSIDAAMADLRGHITDLRDVLRDRGF